MRCLQADGEFALRRLQAEGEFAINRYTTIQALWAGVRFVTGLSGRSVTRDKTRCSSTHTVGSMDRRSFSS